MAARGYSSPIILKFGRRDELSQKLIFQKNKSQPSSLNNTEINEFTINYPTYILRAK